MQNVILLTEKCRFYFSFPFTIIKENFVQFCTVRRHRYAFSHIYIFAIRRSGRFVATMRCFNGAFYGRSTTKYRLQTKRRTRRLQRARRNLCTASKSVYRCACPRCMYMPRETLRASRLCPDKSRVSNSPRSRRIIQPRQSRSAEKPVPRSLPHMGFPCSSEIPVGRRVASASSRSPSSKQ